MSGPRIAVLGAGLIGRRHAEHVAQETVLAAIVDPADGAADIAHALGAPHVESLDELLVRDTPDGLIIATPNACHEAHALACIAAGVPILIEKPIADTVEAASRIVAAAEAAGVAILIGHHRRHNPAIQAAKHAVDNGRLGSIVAVHTTCWFHKPADYFDTAWRREKGAGPVFINLIHDIDTLCHLCGEVASVQAIEGHARGFDVEDTAAALLTFTSGAIGTVTVSDTISAPWSWELTAGENPAYTQTDRSSTLIGGTLGSLSLPDLAVWSHEGEQSWWNPMTKMTIAATREDPLVRQIRHFCDVIRHGAEPLVSGRDGLETLRVVAAIKEAAETGRGVSLR